jgi:lipopolysaccharide/colanic/teichoic acid biosynthesis glycosyltransferase
VGAPILKRAVDVVVGGVLALIALPIIVLLAAPVALLLRGNPFFVQTRRGRHGTPFRMVKIRTLPPSTPRHASKHDLDFDAIGVPKYCAFLRRTHLDELPQLLLVPLGQMSLVGPRPRMLVEEVEHRFDELRSEVRPGCTGLWQISVASSGLATGTPRFDLFYLCHASVRLDVWILLRTIGTVTGLLRPVDVDDVPTWVCGRGFLEAETGVTSIPAPAVEPEPGYAMGEALTPVIEAAELSPYPPVQVAARVADVAPAHAAETVSVQA